MKPKKRAEPFASPEEKKFYGELGYKIMVKRKERGWSQDYLGVQVGVTGQQICKYEDGKDRIKSYTLSKIATVWLPGVSVLTAVSVVSIIRAFL